MKKIMAITACALCVTSFAHADNVGCGLGSVLFSGQKGLAFDLGASFTNGIFSNQAFGMTTGSFGCKKDVRIERRVLFAYMMENYEQFAMEAATGNDGEAMKGAAKLVNMDSKELAKLTHDNFDKIFGHGNDVSEVTENIYDLIEA